MQEAAKTAWSGENVAVVIGDILGPYSRKEWNFPVGSYKNSFWRLARRVSSPPEVQKMLSKSLVYSSSLGSPQLVRNLLEAGADPNCDGGQWGPVHSAAYGGNVEVMRYFFFVISASGTSLLLCAELLYTHVHICRYAKNVRFLVVHGSPNLIKSIASLSEGLIYFLRISLHIHQFDD